MVSARYKIVNTLHKGDNIIIIIIIIIIITTSKTILTLVVVVVVIVAVGQMLINSINTCKYI